MHMYGLKQLLVLALAGSGLACQCTASGVKGAKVDTEATERACYNSGGQLANLGTPNVQCNGACHHDFDNKYYALTGYYTTIQMLKSTCGDDRYGCR
ncbi:hypothetical protein EG327_005087 [Venturia inaequalis]|uniref:Uncharacterized protein n=1 Tax=Venturia inaequalis TaxID=5025 RepID=A0A8H3VBV6_VENIN|nr:hypothetical protein EG327_005087 [Venturia inaequalis]